MTIRKTARFVVDPDHLDDAVAVIREFLAHTASEPGTRLYQSWQSADHPTEFLHLMEFADADAQQRHVSSAAVGAFTSALYPICTTKPEFTDWLGID